MSADPLPVYYDWAPTPPMGWNSWDDFATTVSEAQIHAQAEVMKDKLASHGWNLITVDIQWYEPGANGFNYRPDAKLELDEWGRLIPAPNKFPSAAGGQGFKPLADYLHGLGLKFGIHLMRGIPRQAVAAKTPIKGTTYTAADIADTRSICRWNGDMYGVDMKKAGAQEYYDSVFDLLASWGIDFVKVDDLSAPYHQAEIDGIRKAIDHTGRAIVLSTSPGATPVASGPHISTHANMWRISGDFWDNWPQLLEQFGRLNVWTPFRGPGHFPDADMLPVGTISLGRRVTNLNADEQATLLTLWSVARSPLILGADLTKLDPATLALITNDEVLAVDQASSGNHQLFQRGGFIGWIADVPGSPDKYLALFNTRPRAGDVDTGRAVFETPRIGRRTPGLGASIDVDVTGAKKLFLVAEAVNGGTEGDDIVWSEPTILTATGSRRLTANTWVSATSGLGTASTEHGARGGDLWVAGKPARFGIGAHPQSVIEYDLPADATQFLAFAGIDERGVDPTHGYGAGVRFLVFTKSPFATAKSASVPVNLSQLGMTGAAKIRDLWRGQDLGRFVGKFSPDIRAHGAGLYRITPAD
jgi:hypothetical protein